MVGYFENLFRTVRRRVSRNELIVALLGLPVYKKTDEPGLVLIQIDGLSRLQMERAMKAGRMPFLQRLMKREDYELRTFYSGLPSSTPAVQAELFYGARNVVPAFSFLNRSARRVFDMFDPACAREVENEISQGKEQLLAGGSSWCNIYTGGASTDDSHFCASRLGLGDVFRSRRIIQLLTFPILHFASLIRLLAFTIAEFFVAIGDFVRGVWRGESWMIEIRTLFARVVTCVVLREIMTIGAGIDVARGLPVIHANFIGYDEQSHRRGPGSAFAHWTLGGIDRAIRKIYRATQRSGRREYQLWVYSDHGQQRTNLFRNQGRSLEDIVRSSLDGFDPAAQPVSKPPRPSHRAYILRHGDRISEGHQRDAYYGDEQWFSIAAMGPLGHLYLIHPQARAQKMQLANRLVHEGVPGVIVRNDSGKLEWLYGNRRLILPDDAIAVLPHPEPLKDKIAQDLVHLCDQKCAGDIILPGWNPETPAVSFVDEHGSHAGFSPEETQGFALLPPSTPLPDAEEFIRPSALRAAALHFLKRQPLPARRTERNVKARSLRVMTYNVHGCRGMDGRISPTRIARIIQQFDPDIVALQELDFGRVRSQHHDQPSLIAEALGMKVQFCPTVINGVEQYGHALLSRWPIEIIRTAIFTPDPRQRHVEPRGALWVRVKVGDEAIHLMNTHFGLGRKERAAQTNELLDGNWIGKISEDEPTILCGDFNMVSRSVPYRAITKRLHDAQSRIDDFRPLNTFSTFHPFTRIDHIFISSHFVVEKVLVPRNDLTGVASDHLPLIVDLRRT